MKMNINFCGINFPNPTVLASGYLGVSGASLSNCVKNGVGGVTSKSLFLESREGNNNPSVLAYPGGLISALGFPGEGIKNAKEELDIYKNENQNNPLIGSISGSSISDFCQCAEIMDSYNVDLIELNFSCPYMSKELGKPIAYDAKETYKATQEIRKLVKKPISVKLSANVYNIGEIAKMAEDAGANAITAINSIGPGMLIDIKMKKPILHNKIGGISGAGIKPIAIRSVYEIYENVKIPIIGTGGIINGNDAIEMIMAGASLLGIGSAISAYDLKAFNIITNKMKEFMEAEKIKDIKDIIGIAHN